MSAPEPKQLRRDHPLDPGLAEECLRQSAIIAQADREDPEILAMLDAAWGEIDGWEWR